METRGGDTCITVTFDAAEATELAEDLEECAEAGTQHIVDRRSAALVAWGALEP